MLIRYLLIFLLIWVLWRFVARWVRFAHQIRAELGATDRPHTERMKQKTHLHGREVEDADFEILPDDPPGRD